MRRALLAFSLLGAAAPLHAAVQEPAPSPELAQAGEAFSACIEAGMDGVADSVAPQAAARSILAACQPQQSRVAEAHGRWVASLTVSEAEKRQARTAFTESLTRIEPQLIEAIRQSRAED